MRLRHIALLSAGVWCTSSPAFAAATQVNITDPSATTRAVHVEPGNRLAVQEVPPSSYFHAVTFGAFAGPCVHVAFLATGKALILRQVRFNVSFLAAGSNEAAVYATADCSDWPLATVSAATLGVATVTLDPGIAIPANGTVSVKLFGGLEADAYVDGYTVPSQVVPAVGPTMQVHGRFRAPQ